MTDMARAVVGVGKARRKRSGATRNTSENIWIVGVTRNTLKWWTSVVTSIVSIPGSIDHSRYGNGPGSIDHSGYATKRGPDNGVVIDGVGNNKAMSIEVGGGIDKSR